ncbi:MAG: DUF3618 domain-containing protein [Nocardioides sp.]
MSNQTPEQIEADIERQREKLAETVDALQHRLDVKGRAKDKVAEVKGQAEEKAAEVKGQAKEKAAEVKDRATTDSGKPRPELGAAVAVLVAVVIGVVVWRRRS